MFVRIVNRQLMIAALLLLATSCRSGNQRDRVNTDTVAVKEAKKTMTTRYSQPHANPQLNSYVDAPVKAVGRLAWKAPFNTAGVPASPRDLYALDDRRALLDAGEAFFAVGLEDRKTIGFRRKD